jgi:hypothetical protein
MEDRAYVGIRITPQGAAEGHIWCRPPLWKLKLKNTTIRWSRRLRFYELECPRNEPDTDSWNAASPARTVCEAFEERRFKYGLSQTHLGGRVGGWSAVADGLGKSHLSAILEGLGRATYDCTEPFEKTAERAARIAENGRSHVIVTPFETADLAACVRRLRHLTGGETVVIRACSASKEGE